MRQTLAVVLVLVAAPAWSQKPTVIISGDGAARVVSVGTQGPPGANIPAGGNEGQAVCKSGAGLGWCATFLCAGGTCTFSVPVLGAAAPNCASIPYAFAGDATTGLCTTGAGVVHLYVSGSSQLHLSQTGEVRLGLGALPGVQGGGTYSGPGFNIAIGREAGYSNTTGRILAIGYRAGYSSGAGNDGVLTAVGHLAGFANTDGHATFFGNAAGKSNTTSESTCVGDEACATNTTGTASVLGYYAGYSNLDGYVTAVGYEAGLSNVSGFVSAVGYKAARAATGRASALGHEAALKSTSGNPTAVGYQALYNNVSGNGVGVGIYSGFNATGAVTAIGTNAGFSTTSGPSVSVGYNAGYYNTTGDLISVGYQAGYGQTTANAPATDTFGILIGYEANRSVVTGTQLSNYIGIGYRTLIDKSNQVKIGNSSTLETVLYGNLILKDTGAKPACGAATRGSFWYDEGGAGVADTFEVCRKAATDTYSWVSIF